MKIQKQDGIRLGLYAVLLIIINLVSSSLYFRWDLTKNGLYTLSDASVKAVSSLEEPLTVRFFLSEDLPQPNQTLEQEVRDLMGEYSRKGNRNFNYEVHMIDSKGERRNSQGVLLTDLAAQYGISPVETQVLVDNQFSLKKVYMGMAMIQGDLTRRNNYLGVQDNREKRTNLEYEVTGMIRDLASKTNALLALDQDLKVKLVFSSSLNRMGEGLESYPSEVEEMVKGLENEFYHRLEYEFIDPDKTGTDGLGTYGLNSFGSDEQDGGKLYAALVVEKGSEFSKIELISRSILGNRLEEPADLKEPLRQIGERLLGVQQRVGYLSDHGALPLYSYSQNEESLRNFYSLLSSEYQVTPVTMDSLPRGLKTLVIAGVTEPFSDWELYQLDQFLMRGGSLALFLDPFDEQLPNQQMMMYGAQPQYVPVQTGLEKLLDKYGVKEHQSYLLDKNGYLSRRQTAAGGYQEIRFYNAPEIQTEKVNQALPFMHNLKGMIFLDAAPLEITGDVPGDVRVETLLSSSDKSWEMSDNINLNPQMMTPPPEGEMASYPLALRLTGTFDSYFAGKEIPAPPAPEEGGQTGQEEKGRLLNQALTDEKMVEKGTEGQILLVGSSSVLKDNILDDSGQSSNAMFILNCLDQLSGRGDYALMRSKGQYYNPISDGLPSGVKTGIKVFNIVVLPFLVILVGVGVWFNWIGRKKRIRKMFTPEEEK